MYLILILAKGSLVIDLCAKIPEDIAIAYYDVTNEEVHDVVVVVSGLQQSGAISTPSSGHVPSVGIPNQVSILPSPELSHLQIPAMPPPPLLLLIPSPSSASLRPPSHTSSPAFADVEMGQEEEPIIHAWHGTPFAQGQEGPPPLAETVSKFFL